MKYDKIICWVNAETQQKITKEYINHEIILVSSFDDFMEKITDNSLNLIGASNFDNFDTSGIVYVDHMIHPGYNGTIQTRIDTGL